MNPKLFLKDILHKDVDLSHKLNTFSLLIWKNLILLCQPTYYKVICLNNEPKIFLIWYWIKFSCRYKKLRGICKTYKSKMTESWLINKSHQEIQRERKARWMDESLKALMAQRAKMTKCQLGVSIQLWWEVFSEAPSGKKSRKK